MRGEGSTQKNHKKRGGGRPATRRRFNDLETADQEPRNGVSSITCLANNKMPLLSNKMPFLRSIGAQASKLGVLEIKDWLFTLTLLCLKGFVGEEV